MAILYDCNGQLIDLSKLDAGEQAEAIEVLQDEMNGVKSRLDVDEANIESIANPFYNTYQGINLTSMNAEEDSPQYFNLFTEDGGIYVEPGVMRPRVESGAMLGTAAFPFEEIHTDKLVTPFESIDITPEVGTIYEPASHFRVKDGIAYLSLHINNVTISSDDINKWIKICSIPKEYTSDKQVRGVAGNSNSNLALGLFINTNGDISISSGQTLNNTFINASISWIIKEES